MLSNLSVELQVLWLLLSSLNDLQQVLLVQFGMYFWFFVWLVFNEVLRPPVALAIGIHVVHVDICVFFGNVRKKLPVQQQFK